MTKNTDNAAVTKRRQYEEYSEIITELIKIIYKHYLYYHIRNRFKNFINTRKSKKKHKHNYSFQY